MAYAISGGSGVLDHRLNRDLDTDDPYNTYRRPGLPPGPICSPGVASLHAAAEAIEQRQSLFRGRMDRADTRCQDGGSAFAQCGAMEGVAAGGAGAGCSGEVSRCRSRSCGGGGVDRLARDDGRARAADAGQQNNIGRRYE